MGIAAGFGYGLAQALNEIPQAQLALERHNEAMDLQKRQMNVNEQAEDRMTNLANADIEKYKKGEQVKDADTFGYVKAKEAVDAAKNQPKNDTQVPQVPVAVSSSQKDPGATQTPEQQLALTYDPTSFYQTGEIDQLGNKLTPVSGDPGSYVIAEGQPNAGSPAKPIDYKTMYANNPGVESKDAMVAEPKVPQGGGKPFRTGNRVSTGGTYGMKPEPSAAAKPSPDIMPSSQQSQIAQGKFAVTPLEGTGMLQQADTVSSIADAVEKNRAKILSTIDDQYGKDSTQALYAKRAFMTEIDANISTMRSNAERLRHEGNIANFATVGSKLAQAAVSQLKRGTIDQKWVDSYSQEIAYTGMDPNLLLGMHADIKKTGPTGFILDGKGHVVSESVILKAANMALPPIVRAQAWDDMHRGILMQDKLSQEWARVNHADPLYATKWQIQMASNVLDAYNEADDQLNNNLKLAVKGGPVTFEDETGAKVTVNLPSNLYDPKSDWVAAMAKSDNKDVQSFYKHALAPLYQQRQQLGATNRYIETLNRAGSKPLSPGTMKERADAAAYKTGAETSAKREAQDEADRELEDRRAWSRKNPDKPYPGYAE